MRTARRALAALGPFYIAATLLAVAWLGRRDRALPPVDGNHLETAAHQSAVERFRAGLLFERKGDKTKAHDEFEAASVIDPGIWREEGGAR